jgi:hypothetical protein
MKVNPITLSQEEEDQLEVVGIIWLLPSARVQFVFLDFFQIKSFFPLVKKNIRDYPGII